MHASQVMRCDAMPYNLMLSEAARGDAMRDEMRCDDAARRDVRPLTTASIAILVAATLFSRGVSNSVGGGGGGTLGGRGGWAKV